MVKPYPALPGLNCSHTQTQAYGTEHENKAGFDVVLVSAFAKSLHLFMVSTAVKMFISADLLYIVGMIVG